MRSGLAALIASAMVGKIFLPESGHAGDHGLSKSFEVRDQLGVGSIAEVGKAHRVDRSSGKSIVPWRGVALARLNGHRLRDDRPRAGLP